MTITPASDTTGVAAVSGVLTFTTADWATAQTVTVSGVGAGEATISHAVGGGDYGPNSVTAPDVSVSVAERGVLVDPTTLSVVAGATNVYTVSLATQPTGPVTVTATSDTTGVAAVSGVLTFTTADWATAQTVTVSGVGAGGATISHAVAGGDYGANSVSAPGVAVSVATRGVLVDPTTLSVTAGATATYTVVLATEPTAAVTVTATSDTTGVAAVSGALVFTTADWATAQTVTVTGVGAGGATISHAVGGGDYTSVSAPGVAVSVATRGVLVDPTTLSVTAGASGTYTVVLATEPTGDVTITPSSGDAAVAVVAGVLTFTTADWATAQTVTVSGVAAGGATISHAVGGGDYGANSVTAPDVAVSVAARAVLVAPTAVSVNVGASGTYTVVLGTEPTAAVTVTPNSGDTAVAVVSGVLTFTPADWATAQTVTVSGVGAGEATISHAVGGGDYGTNNVAAPDVAVGVRGVFVAPTALDVVAGASGTYTVALATEPTGDVTITPASGDAAVAAVSGVLTFTTADWATAQTVTVSGVGAGEATISHAVGGGDYGPNSVAAPDVSVSVATRGVLVDPTTLSVVAGATNVYTVSLATQPTGPVTVTATSDTTGVAAVSGVLTFTTADWATAQTVTVSGVGAGEATISHAVGGGDYGANSVTAPDVAVGVRGVFVAPTALDVVAGATGTYTVALATQPTGDVTITPASDTTGVAAVSGVLTFTTADWATAQTVTVSGVAAGEATISHAVGGGDYGANTVSAPGVAVSVATRGVLVDPTALDVVAGTTQTYAVTLASQPTGPVTVTATSGNTAVAVVSGVLTFTTADWATAQTVTVSGVGAGEATISHAVAGADYGTNSVTAPDVSVTVAERGVLVDPTTLSVVAGATNVYTVSLATEPTAAVTVTATSDTTGVAAVSGVLTFTTADWATAQTVTVSGVGAGEATISHAVGGGDYGANTVSAPDVSVSVAARAVLVAPTAVSVNVGASGTYTVVLATEPTGTVTVTPNSGNTAVAAVSGVLTFTTADWATAQTVTVSGAAAGEATISHAVGGGDYGTNNVAAPDVAVGVRGVFVAPTALDVVAGATGTYTVALATEPTGDVTITPASGDAAVAAVSGVLTFTTADWATAQTVTVSGVGAGAATISHAVGGGDYGANTVSAPDVAVSVAERGVLVDPTTLSVVAGATNVYTVSLATQPTGPVTVTATSDTTGVAAVSGVLTFTTADWATAQTVTVSGVGAGEATISHAVAGGDYASVSAPNVAVSVAARGVFVAPTALDVVAGTTQTYAVTLASQPTGPVTVTATSGNTAVAAVSGALVFTTADWATAQTVTVTGVGAGGATISHAVGGGDYTSVSAPGVAVSVAARGVLVDPTTLSVTAGASGTYTVVLATEPTGDVTITPSSGDAAVAVVAGVLTFTTADWATAQTVTVSGVAAGGATISHAVGGGDYGANSVTAPDVAVSVAARAVLVAPTAVSVNVGASGTYTVALATEPTGDVTITPASGDAAVAAVSGVLTFTPADWATAQTVTVSGVGAGEATISHAVGGGDYGTNSVSAPGVAVSVATRGVLVDPTALDVVAGTTQTYAVTLASQPTGPVTVTATSGNTAVAVVSGVLTFTTADWATAQTVTVSGVGAGEATISHAVGGGDYGPNTVSAPDVAVSVATRGVLVDPTTLSVVAGASGTYTVVLATEPTAAVTVTATSDTTGVAAVSGVLTFTTADWATAQTVTVSGVGAGEATISHAVGGGDYGANSVSAPGVAVSVAARGVLVAPTTLSVNVGVSGTYTITLATEPTGPVTVTPASDTTGVAAVSGVLTFTTADWATAQTVTVSGVGAGEATISHAVGGGDYGTNNVAAPDVAVGVRGVFVAPTALDVVAGTTQTYAVTLASQPTGPVTVTATSGNTAVAAVSGALVFTTADWATAQTVTVSGVAAGEATISHAVGGGDYGANSVSAPGVAVSVATRGVLVDPTALDVVAGTTQTYAVTLASQPTGPVTVTATSGNTAVAVVSGVLTFTTADWATAQTVTVSGVGAGEATISHAVGGGDYGANTVSAPDVAVSVATRGVLVDPTTLSVVAGASGTYTVVLATEPTAAVTVTATSDTTGVAAVSGVLTFTTADWATAQTVTVSGVGAGEATISHAVAGGDYASVSAPDVAVSVATRAVLVAPTTLSVNVGVSGTYTITLATEPTGPVTVTPASDTTGVAAVSGVLTFTTADWATAQTVTVSGVAAGEATISHAVAGGDYASVSAPNVAVSVAARGVLVDPTALDVVAGTTQTYAVTLASQPTGPVTVTATSGNTAVAAVSGALVFTTADWATAQTVTVTGVAAGEATISHAVAGGDYASVSAPNVAVSVAERGVLVDPTTLSVIAGATNTYTVVLGTEPTGPVTVTPSSGDAAVAAVSGVLTFTTADWATAQTVTVTGVAAGEATISHAVAGGDYTSVSAPDVAVSVATRGVLVDPTTLSVNVGVSGTYTITLATEPTGTVTVTPVSGSAATATVSGVLSFTTADWATAQTVMVSGVAAGKATISHIVGGGGYASVSAPDVAVSVATRGVLVDPTTLSVVAGATNVYTVSLATQPTGNVTVTATSDTTGVATVSGVLSFTTADWDAAQEVTVSGVAAGDVTVTHTVTGADYASVSAPGVAVTVAERAVLVEPAALVVTVGASGIYEVTLATLPTGTVTVTAASGDTATATVSGALSFTTANWDDAQEVTVSGVAAGDVTVTHTVTGADYASVSAPSVAVTVTIRGVLVEPAALVVTAGASGIYEVTLATPTTGTVTVTPVSGSAATATVSPGVLSFTTANWDVAQEVTVSGVAAGDVTVTHTVTGADYASVSAPSVAVTVTTRGVLTITVRLNPVNENPDRGAMLAAGFSTKFAATAVPADGVPGECTTATSMSKVDDRDTPNRATDDRLQIELNVVEEAAGEDCRYDVRLRLPLGFSAASGATTIGGVSPGARVDVSVGVATRTIFLIQHVIGDSDGGTARYEFHNSCNAPPGLLPPPLLPRPGGGGIVQLPAEYRVPLVAGEFNISEALAGDPTNAKAENGEVMYVLDGEGFACDAVVSVSDLPDRCAAEQESVRVNSLTAPARSLMEIRISCRTGSDATAAVETTRTRSKLGVRVNIISAEVAGTYTVSWATQGGCDPGAGTSGMSGVLTMTVTASTERDSDPTPGELTGPEANQVIRISPYCAYEWNASLVESTTGAICTVGPAPFTSDSNNEIWMTVSDASTSCVQGSSIMVRIRLLTDNPDRNAILAAEFMAHALPAQGMPDSCSVVSAESEVDDRDTPADVINDTVQIELKVVEEAAGLDCRYEVRLRLPLGFSAVRGATTIGGVSPGASVDVSVGVATRTIFLIQSVIGDSGGANARYTLSSVCTAPAASDGSLPGILPAPDAKRTLATRLVRLVPGRFNISAALAADPADPDARSGAAIPVLDAEGLVCNATVSLSDLPDSCTAEQKSVTVHLLTAPSRIAMEFRIHCVR